MYNQVMGIGDVWPLSGALDTGNLPSPDEHRSPTDVAMMQIHGSRLEKFFE